MESYLLDTHTLLWHLEANPKLSKTALDTIEDLDKVSIDSHVTLWEIAIKLTIGKLILHLPFPDLEQKLLDDGFPLLPISPALASCKLARTSTIRFCPRHTRQNW